MRKALPMRPLRTPSSRSIELTPCVKHWFMCGATSRDQQAPTRLRGWFRLMELQCDPEALGRAWTEHRPELVREARAAGFEPAACQWFDDDGRLHHNDFNDVSPGNPAQATWSDRFCSDHGY